MNVFGIQAVSGRAGEVCKIQNLRVSAEYWKLNLTQTQVAQVWTSVYFLTKMYTDIHVHVYTHMSGPTNTCIRTCMCSSGTSEHKWRKNPYTGCFTWIWELFERSV